MVHRALLGSLERFFGILIEHYAGAFPMWLAPVQAAIIPITDHQLEYARDVAAQLKAAGLRVEVNDQNEKLGAKIRLAEKQKVPAMLVVGAKEAEAGCVALRRHGQGDKGSISVTECITQLVTETRERTVPPPREEE